eukprot:CAMPEP_0183827278 /NCGR_PEP_ID=MMETSP0807_2-20130328/2161_1 /TAXON_ID=88271 /ORGANISM="Picocystis salinarum, Strain CCMP1897" /LENGTH=168 /DNA_ID=CAMNT_0026072435 /DNA_START=63 /DNA_END=569 /DNA_ORIENTATION=+
MVGMQSASQGRHPPGFFMLQRIVGPLDGMDGSQHVGIAGSPIDPHFHDHDPVFVVHPVHPFQENFHVVEDEDVFVGAGGLDSGFPQPIAAATVPDVFEDTFSFLHALQLELLFEHVFENEPSFFGQFPVQYFGGYLHLFRRADPHDVSGQEHEQYVGREHERDGRRPL